MNVWKLTVLASLLVAPAWAACPRGPVALPARPACIPEVGQFMSGREAERCEGEIQTYLARAEVVMQCGDALTRERMRNALRQTKHDFEDAVDGLMTTTPGEPGIPNSPPDVGGGAGGGRNGMNVQTSGGQTPAEQGIFVDGTSYGVPRDPATGTSPGTPDDPPGPPPWTGPSGNWPGRPPR